MTSGQRMIFAAVYAAHRMSGRSVVDSVRNASREVLSLGMMHGQPSMLPGDHEAAPMLADMLGTGADR